MPNPAAFVALWLFFSSATAQIGSVDCTLANEYSWAYNSINQTPCKVAAYLQSTCFGGTFTVDPLWTLPGNEYAGPSLSNGGDICRCNTVVYSLMSACAACQAGLWIDWITWATNCTTVSVPGAFPNPVPQGTYVPQWALADVTRELLSLWDSITAMGIGDSPEIGPGQLIGGSSGGTTTTINGFPSSGSSANFPTATTPFPLSPSMTSPLSSSSSPSPSKGSSSNTGAIVGGAVGGVAVIAVAVVVTLFMRRRRPQAPSSEYKVESPPQPPYASQNLRSGDGTNTTSMIANASEKPTAPMGLYDPNNPSTFPRYNATGNLIANTQTSSHL